MTIIITGAKGGLGRAVVDRFLAAGCSVVGVDRQCQSKALEPDPERAGLSWLSLDVTDGAAVAGLPTLLGGGGEIGGLVHLAGGFRFGEVASLEEADLDFLLNTNLRSSFLLARTLAPRLKKSSSVVFISAAATQSLGPGMAAYLASKAGVNVLTQSLAAELKTQGVTVNAVLPSIIDTPANRQAMPDADFSTWVTPEQLAEIIFSLTQPWGRPVTGALIPVTGRV